MPGSRPHGITVVDGTRAFPLGELIRMLLDRASRPLAGLAFAAACLGAAPVVWRSAFGVNDFQDDAWYYVVAAKNFIGAGIFSLDGATATNGFHPLWMAMLLALFGAIGIEAPLDCQVLATTALEQALFLFAVVACIEGAFRHSREELAWRTGYLALLAFLLFPGHTVFRQGMETTLAALAFVFVVRAYERDSPRGLGLALALLFLARLDTAVFVAAPLLAWSAGARVLELRRLAAAAAPIAVAFAAYSAVNLAATGHVIPISGAIKSSFPVPHWNAGFLAEPLNLVSLFGWRTLFEGVNLAACIALTALGIVAAVFARASASKRKILGIGLVAAVLAANLLLFQRWQKSIDPRYLVLPTMAALFFAAATAQLALERLSPPRLSRLLPIALLAALALEAIDAARHLAERAARRENTVRAIFEEITRALPANAVLAGTDVGAMSFWTRRPVVNLDGVMNTFEYQDRIAQGGLKRYLRERGVTHLGTILWDREQSYTGRPAEPMYRHVIDPAAQKDARYPQHRYFVYSYLHGRHSDALVLRPGEEVYRRYVGRDGIAEATYVVYALTPESLAER